jgi:hypothetical protein
MKKGLREPEALNHTALHLKRDAEKSCAAKAGMRAVSAKIPLRTFWI